MKLEGAQETSTSTRQNIYDNEQHTSRVRRPITGSRTARPRDDSQASYNEPPEWENLNEDVVGPPAHDEKGQSLEQARSRSDEYDLGPTRRGAGGEQEAEDQLLSETAAPPPVQSSGARPSDLESTAEERYLDDGERERLSSASPPPFAQRMPEDYMAPKRPPPRVPRPLTELYTISYLIFFSILGTLARLGVQWLTFYPGAPLVTPVLWANFGGSFLMGFLAEDQALFSDAHASVTSTAEKRASGRSNLSCSESLHKAERAKRKKTIPLYIGLATGFCGSFTSFSSFARDSFLAISNNLPTPINHPNALVGTPSTNKRPKRASSSIAL